MSESLHALDAYRHDLSELHTSLEKADDIQRSLHETLGRCARLRAEFHEHTARIQEEVRSRFEGRPSYEAAWRALDRQQIWRDLENGEPGAFETASTLAEHLQHVDERLSACPVSDVPAMLLTYYEPERGRGKKRAMVADIGIIDTGYPFFAIKNEARGRPALFTVWKSVGRTALYGNTPGIVEIEQRAHKFIPLFSSDQRVILRKGGQGFFPPQVIPIVDRIHPDTGRVTHIGLIEGPRMLQAIDNLPWQLSGPRYDSYHLLLREQAEATLNRRPF